MELDEKMNQSCIFMRPFLASGLAGPEQQNFN